MISRFEGDTGRRLLIDTLKEQKLVAGNQALAEEIAHQALLIEFKANDVLIHQGALDNDVYFILTGTCAIVVNGRQVAVRGPGNHVGEMAAIQPSQVRSATVIAQATVVVCKFTEPQLTALATRYPDIWLLIAKELARRLEQRNALVSSTHDKIRIFIISSAEALHLARAVQNAFEFDPFTVTVWTDGVFRVSNYPIDSLQAQVQCSDFAIAIIHPDDLVLTRDNLHFSPRDNVLFELGLFMGTLGKQRSFLVEPRGEDIKLPSDLSGLATLSYKQEPDPKDLPAAIAPVCNRIRDVVRDLGPNN